MNDVVILIPPSEGKREGGEHKPLKKVSSDVGPMLKALEKVKLNEWGKLLGVKDKALEQAIKSNQSILTSKTLPAIERYTGVVYNGIEYDTLKKEAKKFFNEHVKIVSALFGLVSPQDLIPDYKLKIEKLGADKYWKPINARQLSNKFVIDLLPKAHKKGVYYDDGIAVEFVIMKDNKKKPAGHQGKFIKGRFIRWLVENRIKDEKDFEKFQEDGFCWINGQFIKKV